MYADTKKVFDLMPQIDVLMVTAQKNRKYFTDFNSTFGILLISRDKNIFITDGRYGEKAGAVIKNAQVRSGPSDKIDGLFSEAFDELKAVNIGFEDNEITVRIFEQYKKLLAGKNTEFIPASSVISKMRLVKADWEIEKIAQAQEITDKAFSGILKFIKPGVTEIEISNELERLVKLYGAQSSSFEIIVGSGVNGSMPHAQPSGKRVEKGEAITLDFGAKVDGYRSDMTRTVFLGKPDAKISSVYQTVLKAQTKAIEKVKAGVLGRELDEAARNVLRADGLEDNFIHSLGHGVGLDIHEEPSLNAKCEVPLEKNMVIAVEPGVYLPGVGGVRIEDLLVVSANGCKNLTKSSKEFIIL